MAAPLRKPKDRDFIETKEGLLFCVTGYLHPPDRYTAYLKYSPATEGKWKGGQIYYRRVLEYYHVGRVSDTITYLEQTYPQYVHYCPVRGIKFSMIPRSSVAKYCLPEQRLRQILESPGDPLEEEVSALVAELTACSGIQAGDFGITGSILLGIHNPEFSDIDLLVYGEDNARKLRTALRQGKLANIRLVTGKVLQEWCASVTERFPLSHAEARYLGRRRWNYGFFSRRYFSIHPARKDHEILEEYGDRCYSERGMARVRAIICDAREALFMPAVYRIRDAELIQGEPRLFRGSDRLKEIVSYEGLYRDVADAGQEIEAKGKLESVSGQYYRLVIGTTLLKGEGYIKPISNKIDEG